MSGPTHPSREGTHVDDDSDTTDPDTVGGKDQEDVEDRPNVSTVSPEDYPQQQ